MYLHLYVITGCWGFKLMQVNFSAKLTLIEILPSCSSLTTFLYLASSSPYCWRSSGNSFRTSLQRFRGQGRLDLGSFAAILLLEGCLTDWVLK